MVKTALITGAARGIGAASARALHRDGFEVIINYNRSEAAALTLARELNARAIRADVSEKDQVKAMFDEAGRIDILINNAGIAHYGLFTDSDETLRRQIFSVNVEGAMNCCAFALPGMIAQKQGIIINISSVWGIYGASCEAVYSASKSAVTGLTLSLAKELGPSGIRVNCVAPGAIDTGMTAGFSDADKANLAEKTPLCRLGTALDVAELVSFLAQDRAAFITGQIIGVDGGFIG
ncbi:MAG: SDR family oxidoreductase [Oscillospiraceae bacterium]|nr:SDR family oxidoreductase [Oscillospiraceae bacterium]